MFGYSGGNKIFLNQLHASPLVDVGVDSFRNDYRRDNERSAPDDLYCDTTKLFDHAHKDARPRRHCSLTARGQPATGAGIVPSPTHVGSRSTRRGGDHVGLGPGQRHLEAGPNHTRRTPTCRQQVAPRTSCPVRPYHNVSGIRIPRERLCPKPTSSARARRGCSATARS